MAIRFLGFSFVYIIFEDGTDLYWARSRVLEYLNFVAGRLPQGVTPSLGPDATGVGWVYEYMLESDQHDLAQLRSIQDWFLRYELASVPGVSEVASIGGYVKQYQVIVDPNKLRAYNISLQKIKMAVQRSNKDVGGKLVEMGETEFMVRGLGYIKGAEESLQHPLKGGKTRYADPAEECCHHQDWSGTAARTRRLQRYRRGRRRRCDYEVRRKCFAGYQKCQKTAGTAQIGIA